MKKVWIGIIIMILLSPFVFLFLYLFLSYISMSEDLGNGFEYMNSGRYDYYHIYKNDNVVVKNAVVDIAQVGNFIAGIQLPSCSNTHPQKIILSKKIAYFILNTSNGIVVKPNTRSEFDKVLKSYGIYEQVNLDFDQLIRLRESYYKKYTNYPKEKLEYCNNVEYKNHLTSHLSRTKNSWHLLLRR